MNETRFELAAILKDIFQQSWGRYLLAIAAAAIPVGVLWLVLQLFLASPDLPVERKLGLMAGMAFLFLLCGATGLHRATRKQRASLAHSSGGLLHSLLHVFPSFSFFFVLGLTYGVPLLAFQMADWLVLWNRFPQDRLAGLLGAGGLAAGQPWSFLWQAGVLAGYQLLRLAAKPVSFPDINAEHLWEGLGKISTWLLAGLGLWLLGGFAFGLLAAPLGSTDTALPASYRILIPAFALLVAPWAEELFFRKQLLEHWQSRMGSLPASLASAALFASLPLRPLLWLPAFILGVGLAEITRRSERLLPAVLVHALYNGLMVLLNWYLIV